MHSIKQLLINNLNLQLDYRHPPTPTIMQSFVGCGFVFYFLLLLNVPTLKAQNCFSSAKLEFTDYNCVNYNIYTFTLSVTAQAPEQESTFSINGHINLGGLEYETPYEFSFIELENSHVFIQIFDELNQCDTLITFGGYDYPHFPHWQITNIDLEECRIENGKIKQLAKIYLEHDYPIERLCGRDDFWINYIDETNTYHYENIGHHFIDSSYLEIEIYGYKQLRQIQYFWLPDYKLNCNLSDLKNTVVFAFPTIVNNEIYIHIKDNFTPQSIEIYAVNGKYIEAFQLDENSINLSSLERGIYVLQLTVNNQIHTIKFFKT